MVAVRPNANCICTHGTFAASCAKRNRNVSVAETVVRESKSFTDREALDQKLIDVIAKDEQDLLAQVNNRAVTRFDGSTYLVTGTANGSTTANPTEPASADFKISAKC